MASAPPGVDPDDALAYWVDRWARWMHNDDGELRGLWYRSSVCWAGPSNLAASEDDGAADLYERTAVPDVVFRLGAVIDALPVPHRIVILQLTGLRVGYPPTSEVRAAWLELAARVRARKIVL